MRLARLPHDPGALVDFFQEGLEGLGAVCERIWHDRLRVLAEGHAASLWNAGGELLDKEIHFPPPDETAPRQADQEVFPGCPLTFRLAEALNPPPLRLDRAVLDTAEDAHAPAADVARKLWHLQHPGTTRWEMESAFQFDWHFSLLVLARCEIQATDQHWSLHRLAVSLPDGERDEALAEAWSFAALAKAPDAAIPWPAPDTAAWQTLLQAALAQEIEADLAAMRERQQSCLRRELERIDDYFEHYEKELHARQRRQHRTEAKLKLEERLAAARAEHERRRHDQVQRHEIRVIPHLDALVLLAEPAWRLRLTTARRDPPRTHEARFIPRSRRWLA